MRAFIANTELDLPPDFTLPLELHSPVYDFDLRTGDFSMNIEFPFTPRNRVAFGFADEPGVAEKQLEYPDFRLDDGGEIRAYGTLVLQEAKREQDRGTFVCDFFTNLFNIDIYTRKLWEVITKEVDLGSTPVDIVTAAAAQNTAAMSADGITGSVMKFIPTLATEFYGDKNPDWLQEFSEYRRESEYEQKAVVEFRMPEFINDFNMPNAIQHAIIPRLFVAALADPDNPVAAESPFAAPTKWDLHWQGILNNTSASAPMAYNTGYLQFFGIVNTQALSPYLQMHDVVRQVCAALGYTAKGAYMDDANERLCLLQSNFAQDLSSGKVNFIYVGTEVVIDLGSNAVATPVEFELTTVQYDNASGHYDTAVTILVPKAYIVPVDGWLRCRFKARVRNYDLAERVCLVAIRKYDPVADATVTLESFSTMIPADGEITISVETVVNADAGWEIYPSILTATAIDSEMNFATFEVQNLDTDDVNIYDGTVRYADHMPDITVAEFLNALGQWKNLHITIDTKAREFIFDYQDEKIADNKDPQEIGHLRTDAGRLETRPKKRFSLNYGDVAQSFKKPQGHTELVPVTCVADLPPPHQANTYILVENENAYYQTAEYEYGGRLVWIWAGYNWPDLEIDTTGELVSIRPAIGPVPIRRFIIRGGREMIGPVLEGAGRSNMFYTEAGRQPLRVLYWAGNDTSYYVGSPTESVPLGTITKLNQAGVEVLTIDALWSTLFELHWKRTLQMLVLEERYTALFHMRPDERARILFSKILLIDSVPMMPIRHNEQIGGSRLLEIEFRKVKVVRINAYYNFENISGSGGSGGGGGSTPGAGGDGGDCECEGGISWIDTPFTAELTFDGYRYMEHTVAGAIAFTKAASGHVAMNRVVIYLTANGTNIPTYSSDFVIIWGNYNNTASVVNVLTFVLAPNGKILTYITYQ